MLPPTLGASAAALGLAFHQLARTIDFERTLLEFFAVEIIAFFALLFSFVHGDLGGLPFAHAFVSTILLQSIFHVSLFLSIGIYRLFFHRCGTFPGPLGSKITQWYSLYLHARRGQYHKELAGLHAQYGDFVRTGPREITVFRASAVNILHGPGSRCHKSVIYDQIDTDSRNNSVHMTRDPALSRLRRKVWERGLSFKALDMYQPRIKSKVDLLVQKLAMSSGKPMDATKWSMLFGFDVMGEVGFSTDFESLQNEMEHEATKPLHDSMGLAYNVGATLPWLLYIIVRIPGAAGAMEKFVKLCNGQLEAKKMLFDRQEHPRDLLSWMLKAVDEKDPSAAPTKKALDEDSRNLIVAGSDTTATTLAHCLFYLAKCPEAQKRLQSLIDEAAPGGHLGNSWDYEKIKNVKQLDEFIFETLRLKPALKVGGSRQTPAQGIKIDEVYIPGDVNVIVPMEQLQRDCRYWQQADMFLPERWGTRRTELETDQSPYMPFLLGAYACPGKNLALLTLRMSLAAILSTFDISFAPGEDGTSFENDELDTFVVTLAPLNLQFYPRPRVC